VRVTSLAPRGETPHPPCHSAAFLCLRRGLGLKDGPGKRKIGCCQCLAGVGVHPLAISQDRPSRLRPTGEGRSASRVLHLHPWGQARYPGGWPTARG
jgi:hypothetical protein